MSKEQPCSYLVLSQLAFALLRYLSRSRTTKFLRHSKSVVRQFKGSVHAMRSIYPYLNLVDGNDMRGWSFPWAASADREVLGLKRTMAILVQKYFDANDRD